MSGEENHSHDPVDEQRLTGFGNDILDKQWSSDNGEYGYTDILVPPEGRGVRFREDEL